MFSFAFPWMHGYPFPGTDTSAAPGDWAAPRPVPYAGDRTIEDRVTAEVASFGRQIGILTEALLEIADGEAGPAVDRLRSVATRVETVKAHFNRALEEKAEEAFKALLEADPVAAGRLVDAMERRVSALETESAGEDSPRGG